MRLFLNRLLMILFALTTFTAARATTTTSVSITPGYTTLAVSGTLQYSANVIGLSSMAITWEINGVIGGNSTLGTISTSGFYRAPVKAPRTSILVEAVAEDGTMDMVYVNVVAAGPPIAAVLPNPITPGNFKVTVFGSGFVHGATVALDGVALATTYVNSTTLTAAGYYGNNGMGKFQAINPSGTWGTPFTATFGAAVSPATATVLLGSTQQFTYPDATSWSATAGTISSTGRYSAPTTMPSSRIVTIRANGSGGSAIATVTLSSGQQTISPATVNLQLGAGQQFTSSGATSWSVSAGTISSTGYYTAPSTMPSFKGALVTATGPGGSASSVVALSPTQQTILPTSAIVTVGTTQQFTAAGATTWSASAGTVSASGLYTAPASLPSNTSVSVTASGPNGSATAAVSLVGAVAQTISPASATVPLGKTQQFTSAGATTWTASAGTISSTGLFTAPASVPGTTGAPIASLTSMSAQTPGWSQLTNLPKGFTAGGGGIIYAPGDGNLYAAGRSGSTPNIVITMWVAPESSMPGGTWTNITTPTISPGTETTHSMGVMPNGTVLLSETGGGTAADVFYWNGSTTSPTWTKVTGWHGLSSSSIYNFTNDSAGYTYFSPAWSGDIWRNSAPNSTNFIKVFSNLYGLVGGAGGGLYELQVWNLGDGRGDTLWACGEGGLLNVDLKFSKTTQYLDGGGYTGNCYGLAKSATNILALRTANGNGDAVNKIDITGLNTTIMPTSSGYPVFSNTNFAQGFSWMSGTNWMFNTANSGGTNVALLLSQNDGTSWTDVTAAGIPSSCTGTNLSLRALATANYIYARCQNGTSFWQYGPVAPAAQTPPPVPTPPPTPTQNPYYVTAIGPNGTATATVTLVGTSSQVISPTAATVTLGQTQQFSSNGATSWTASVGSVSSSGLYTAPTTMPASTTVSVTASGPNGSATAAVSLVKAASQTISPAAVSVVLGQTQQFTSTGATSWTASVGSVTSTGLYTAPVAMPASSSVTVTAAGPNGSATATISLTAPAGLTISPASISIALGKTVQFTAAGATSWSSTAGIVSSSGLFTAPSTMPSVTTASVTANGAVGSATAIVTFISATTAPPPPTGAVSISTQNPLYGWQVIPGATRRIHATVLNGSSNQVSWSFTTTGGASATVVPAASPNLPGAFVDVTLGPVGSTCTNVGTSTAPVFSSAASVTLTATSVDDPTQSTTVPINVCNPTVQVFVAPFNLRLYAGQKVNLQSWVWGSANDNVTWSVMQPTGGNGAFIAPPAGGSATTARDAVFSATGAGKYVVTATSVANPSAFATAILSVDSASLPTYAVTPNHTEPVDCSVDPTQAGKTYDVGPGHPYAMLADAYVAIGSDFLTPGTTIRLFNADTTGTNPTRYHEYLRLDGQGTQAAPIRVVGCADSAGNLPILDAQNATSYSPTDNSVAANIAGLYQIGMHHSNGFAVYPTTTSPAYIVIEGLAFRNAYPTTGSASNYYYNPGSGTATQWGTSTSCIRPYEGDHLTVRGNDMQDCSFGILADFNGNNGWGGFFGDFDLQGNYFANIGANNQSEHMAYVQGFRQIIQGNVFDTLKPVSQAGMLKMRGVAEIVRYNYFNTTSNTRTIDFVEEQDSNMYMSFLGYYYTPPGSMSFRTEYPSDAYTPDMIAAADEAWHKAYAYGNIINFGPNTPTSQAPIHFFGDQGQYVDVNTNPPVRVGDLFDYSNTIYSVGGNSLHLVDTQQNSDNQLRWEWPTLHLWNNATYVGPLNTPGAQAFQMSTLRSDLYDLGPNWLSSNWGTNDLTCSDNSTNGCIGTGWPYQMETSQYMDGGNLPAHVTGLSNLITGGSTLPFSTTNFIPTVGGGLVGAGAALPSSISNMPVRFQMTAPTFVLTPRTNPLTLGAHD